MQRPPGPAVPRRSDHPGAGYAITFANIATEQGFAIDTFYLTPERGLTREPHPLETLADALRGVVS